jgi:hypothetical protein
MMGAESLIHAFLLLKEDLFFICNTLIHERDYVKMEGIKRVKK